MAGDIMKLGKLNFKMLEVSNNYSTTRAEMPFYNTNINVIITILLQIVGI